MSNIPNEEESIIQEEDPPTEKDVDEEETETDEESLFDMDEMDKEEL